MLFPVFAFGVFPAMAFFLPMGFMLSSMLARSVSFPFMWAVAVAGKECPFAWHTVVCPRLDACAAKGGRLLRL